jgi:hypothetical protein
MDMNRRFFLLLILLALVVAWIAPTVLALGYDWTQFDGSSQHSGNNTQDTGIGVGNVSALFKLFTVSLPNTADGAPAYLSGVSTLSGTRDLFFLTTKDGHILALDAHSGASIWSHQYGPGSCKINLTGGACYTTSSPAIDPNRQFVYGYGLDGFVHKYQVGDGTEIKSGGWPELATTKGYNEKGSAALSIATDSSGHNYLYVANGGYPGDNGDYQGHVTTINLSTGTQHIFNTMCSNQTDVHFVETPSLPDCAQTQSAVWARAAVIYDPATNKIYFGTGNGTFDPPNFYWGDSILALNPDGTGARNVMGTPTGNPLDSFTPNDYQQLQNSDADLGSTAPAVLPVPTTSVYPNLAVQGGKDALLRLVDLDNLSGQGGPGHTAGEIGTVIPVPQGGEVLTQPAVWVHSGTTWVFVANDSGISAFTLLNPTTSLPSLHLVWQDPTGGTSPLIVNGVLFSATGGLVRGLNATDGTQLWSDNSIGGIHWESPVVANSTLSITDENGHLSAFGLRNTRLTPTPPSVATSTPTVVSGRSSRITPTPTAVGAATSTPAAVGGRAGRP